MRLEFCFVFYILPSRLLFRLILILFLFSFGFLPPFCMITYLRGQKNNNRNPGSISPASGDWAPYESTKQWFVDFGSEVRVGQHPSASMTQNSSVGVIGTLHKLNCDTWKHAFKI